MAQFKKTKVVLVGCGGMSQVWLNSSATKKCAELVGFVDINYEAAAKKAEEFGVKNAVVGTNLKKVIQESGAEVMYDVSIPEAHYQNTITALNMGLHVMGEKPMADTLSRAKKMVEVANKNNRLYTVIQNRRYMKDIQIIKNALESGVIGKVHTIQSDFRIGVHFGGFRDEMEYPLVLDMAIHTFDAARFLSGSNATSVYCHSFNPKESWYSHGASSTAIYEMTNDITYVYNGSWCSLGANTSWEADWIIQGTKGAITWDGGEGVKCEVVSKKEGFVWPTKEKKLSQQFKKTLCDGHSSNIQAFFDAVETGKKAMTDCTDNIHSLAMVEYAIQSDKKNKKIQFKL